MIAIGAGGLDVAVAMADGTYTLNVPAVVKVNLTGKLKEWCSAKDVILHVLKILTVKGGVGKIIEYTGEGVKSLSVTDRATITNMGAELGATTSIFPRVLIEAAKRRASWSSTLMIEIGRASCRERV